MYEVALFLARQLLETLAPRLRQQQCRQRSGRRERQEREQAITADQRRTLTYGKLSRAKLTSTVSSAYHSSL